MTSEARRATGLAARAERFEFESGYEIMIESRRLETAGREIVHLDFGEPDFPTPPHIVAAGEAALRAGHTHYTPAGGMRELRGAIAEHVRRTRGVEVEPEQVVVSSGSTQVLLLVMLALLQEGRRAVLPDPCYPIYRAMVQLAGGGCVTVPLRPELDYRWDAGELGEALDGASLLLLNSPSNPTGGVLTEADLRDIAGLCQRHDVHAVCDEVYADLVYEGAGAPSLLAQPGMADRTVYVDSLSKGYAMCGWRLGFAVAPLPLARRLEAMMMVAGLCAPSIAQVAAVEALRSPLSAGAVAAMRREFARRRDLMVGLLRGLPGVRCHRPAGAFYTFPDVAGTGQSDGDLARRLLREGGVAVLPGSMFGSHGADHLRISYAASAAQIEEGLRRMAAVIEAPGSGG